MAAAVSVLVLPGPVRWWLDRSELAQVQEAKDRIAAITSARQIALAAAAGTAALVGLAFTARTYYLSRRGQLTDRYTKAIAQLASDKLTERLGGIYALEHLMLESSRDHNTVIEVLAAFIRESAPAAAQPPPTEEAKEPVEASPENPSSESTRPETDVQAALTVLGRRPTSRTEPNRIDLSQTNLQGANLGGAQLQRTNLFGAQLQRSYLGGAQLQHANLSCAELQHANLAGAQLLHANLFGAQLQRSYLFGAQLHCASLGGAQLQHANLSCAELQHANLAGAQLYRANLARAQLQHAHLFRAQLQHANLSEAQLHRANLARAQLQHANLSRAELQHASLAGAQLQGTDLAGAKGLTKDQLSDAIIDDRTRLDLNLDNPSSSAG